MSLSFAGVEMLLEDKGGAIQHWLDSWLPVSDLRLTSPTVALDADDEWLPLPRYPELPPPRLNTFVMPTGATRWGYGLFLVDEAKLEEIKSKMNSATSKLAAGTLIISSHIDDDPRTGVGGEVKLKVHALPARKVSFMKPDDAPSNEPPAKPLWILPLVDSRYFWQFGTMQALETQPTPSNKCLYGLLSNCADSLGAMFSKSDLFYHGTVITSKSSDVGDVTNQIQIVLANGIGNTAAVMESAIQSAGQHLVPYWPAGGGANHIFNGQYNVVAVNTDTGTPSSLNVKWANNQYSARVPLGKSFFVETAKPKQIKIRFPKWINGIVRDDEHYVYTKNVAGTGSDVIRLAYCNALACDEATTPARDNIAMITSIGDDIADAIIARKYAYDLTFTGIVELAHTAIDDYVEWTQRIVHGEYAPHTRVQSLPTNFGLQRYCKYALRDDAAPLSSGPSRLGNTINGVLRDGLAAFGFALLRTSRCDGPTSILGWPAFHELDTRYWDITVYDGHTWDVALNFMASATRLQRRWVVTTRQE